MTKYLLEITAEQAHVLARASELFARLHMGQLNILADEFIFAKQINSDNLLKLREGLKQLEPLITGLKQHANKGIHGLRHERAQIAWDLYQTIRHRLSWDEHAGGGFTVNFDKPFKCCDHPLAEITIMELEE